MNKNKWVVIYKDDWVGIYKNGKLQIEGHELNIDDIFYLLGIELEDQTDTYYKKIYDKNFRRLPDNLEEL